MNDRQWKLFLQVVDAGSFAKAAAAGYVSTQSVAQQIARLEEEVGTPLLDRTPRGVVPTEAGRFYEGAQGLDRTLDALLAQCRTVGNPQRTLIRLGSGESYSLDLFSKFVPDFLRKYPGSDIDYCAVGADPLTDLADGLYDVVEGTDVQVDDARARGLGIAFEPLLVTRRCCTVSTKSPLARKDSVAPDDLAGLTVYVFSLEWAQGLRRYLEGKGLTIDLHEFNELPTRDHRSLSFVMGSENMAALLPEHMAEKYSPLICLPFEADVQMRYGLLFREDDRERFAPFLEVARAAF